MDNPVAWSQVYTFLKWAGLIFVVGNVLVFARSHWIQKLKRDREWAEHDEVWNELFHGKKELFEE